MGDGHVLSQLDRGGNVGSDGDVGSWEAGGARVATSLVSVNVFGVEAAADEGDVG